MIGHSHDLQAERVAELVATVRFTFPILGSARESRVIEVFAATPEDKSHWNKSPKTPLSMFLKSNSAPNGSSDIRQNYLVDLRGFVFNPPRVTSTRGRSRPCCAQLRSPAVVERCHSDLGLFLFQGARRVRYKDLPRWFAVVQLSGTCVMSLMVADPRGSNFCFERGSDVGLLTNGNRPHPVLPL